MKTTAIKLAISIVAAPLSLFLVGLTGHGFFFLFFLLSLPLIVLYWVDLGRILRATQTSRPHMRLVGMIMGVPQALFGLLSLCIGLAIVLWVLYNTFVDSFPAYSGGFLTFGIGPALILFGIGWLVSAFRKEAGGVDGA